MTYPTALKTIPRRHSLLLVALILALPLAGCGEDKSPITSKWKDREIRVDGDNSDWKGVKLSRGKYLSIGALNDDSGLYIYAETDDPRTGNQLIGVLGQSYITWFVADEKWNDKWGVQLRVNNRYGINPSAISDPPPPPKSSALDNQSAFIIKAGDSSAEMREAAPDEVSARVGTSGKTFFCELFVSLARLGTGTGKPLSVGFETTRIDRERLESEMREKRDRERSGMRRRTDGGNQGGFSMDEGGGRRGRGSGWGKPEGAKEKDLPDEIVFWREVVLARTPTGGQSGTGR